MQKGGGLAIPLELPRAAEGSERAKWNGRSASSTFPDACPQDIAVVDVHHDPLTIQWIFVNRSVP